MRSRTARRGHTSFRSLRLESLETRDVFAAGGLDTSFGTDGIARVANDPTKVETWNVAGNLYVMNGAAGVLKLNSQGAITSNYGSSGQATVGHRLIAVQSTGAVIAGNDEVNFDTNFTIDSAVTRLLPTGAADNTFNTTGKANIDFAPKLTTNVLEPNTYDNLAELTVDGSDRVWALVRGTLSSEPSLYYHANHFAGVVRLNSNGSFDSSFDADGLMSIEVPTTDGFFATDLQLTADGGAMLVGSYSFFDADLGETRNLVTLYKIDANGALVTSFGTNGRVQLPQFGNVPLSDDIKISLDPVSGGFYIAAYHDLQTGSHDLTLGKITATGAAATFGTGGVVNVGNVETDASVATDGYDLAVQADGKPLVIYGGGSWNLARFTTAGVADSDFGTNGVVTTTLGTNGGAYANPQSLLVQSDGMILVSGKFSPGGTDAMQSIVARYFSIDSAAAPSSSVSALAAVTYTNDFTVSWSGTPTVGSNITGYDVYYKIGSQTPVLWQSNVTATSAVFNVQAARHQNVGFYSIARDNLNRVEAAPSSPDTTTNYIGAPWQNPVNKFDVLTGGTDTGRIDPGDILYVITEFGAPEISDLNTKDVIIPPTRTYTNGRFVDVDGDNVISPADILFVITEYERIQSGNGEGEAAASAASAPAFIPPAVTSPPAVASPASATTPPPAATADDDLLAQLAAAWLAADSDEDE